MCFIREFSSLVETLTKLCWVCSYILYVWSGRAAQQKTICTILKDVVYTPGSYMVRFWLWFWLLRGCHFHFIQAWEDTLSSWKSLTTILKSCECDDSPPPQPDVLKLGTEVIVSSNFYWASVSMINILNFLELQNAWSYSINSSLTILKVATSLMTCEQLQ